MRKQGVQTQIKGKQTHSMHWQMRKNLQGEYISQDKESIAKLPWFAGVVAKESQEMLTEFLLRNLEDPSEREFEFYATFEGGNIRWFSVRSSLVLNEANVAVERRETIYEITGYKQREQNLINEQQRLLRQIAAETPEKQQDMARRFHEFAQAIPDCSLIVDETGWVLDVFGPRQEWLFGETSPQTMKRLTDMLPTLLADWLLEGVRVAIGGAGLQQGEVDCVLAGANRTVGIRVIAMSYMVDEKRTAAVTFQDVTDQSRLRRLVQNSYDRRRRSEFFHELLQHRYKTESELVAQCWRLGIDARSTFVPVVAKIVWLTDGKEAAASELDQQIALEAIVDELASAQDDWVSWTNGDSLGLLWYGDSVETARNEVLQLALNIGRQFEGMELAWGISDRLKSLLELPNRYEQAKAAALFNRQYKIGGVTHYNELGMDQVLISLPDTEKKQEFIQRQLGPLLEYDARKGTELVGTLAEILRHGNLKLVADHLYLHHKTVVFRKKRIEELLQCSLDSFETKMALVTALKLLRLDGHIPS